MPQTSLEVTLNLWEKTETYNSTETREMGKNSKR